MSKLRFATFGASPALTYARNQLESWGYPICTDPTQANHVLLPVPSGSVAEALPPLASDTVVYGGNLADPGYPFVDLLQDPYYLNENAAITAQCALHYGNIRPEIPVLVIGWGRIGKHLAALLAESGTNVTVAVRKEQDLHALQTLGFSACLLPQLQARQYAVIFNTAPAPILHQQDCKENATLVDLASTPGIIGPNVIWARGLPGKDAPERSGNLIAKTVLRYALGKE